MTLVSAEIVPFPEKPVSGRGSLLGSMEVSDEIDKALLHWGSIYPEVDADGRIFSNCEGGLIGLWLRRLVPAVFDTPLLYQHFSEPVVVKNLLVVPQKWAREAEKRGDLLESVFLWAEKKVNSCLRGAVLPDYPAADFLEILKGLPEDQQRVLRVVDFEKPMEFDLVRQTLEEAKQYFPHLLKQDNVPKITRARVGWSQHDALSPLARVVFGKTMEGQAGELSEEALESLLGPQDFGALDKARNEVAIEAVRQYVREVGPDWDDEERLLMLYSEVHGEKAGTAQIPWEKLAIPPRMKEVHASLCRLRMALLGVETPVDGIALAFSEFQTRRVEKQGRYRSSEEWVGFGLFLTVAGQTSRPGEPDLQWRPLGEKNYTSRFRDVLIEYGAPYNIFSSKGKKEALEREERKKMADSPAGVPEESKDEPRTMEEEKASLVDEFFLLSQTQCVLEYERFSPRDPLYLTLAGFRKEGRFTKEDKGKNYASLLLGEVLRAIHPVAESPSGANSHRAMDILVGKYPEHLGLLAERGFDVHVLDLLGRNGLMRWLTQNVHESMDVAMETLQTWVNLGAELDCQDILGRTPRGWLADHGWVIPEVTTTVTTPPPPVVPERRRLKLV